jgi:hypothetical protein
MFKKNSVWNLFLMLVLIMPPLIFAQDGAQSSFSGIIPEILRRPSREKSAIYPSDIIIGQLGDGDASPAANTFARIVLRDLMRQNKSAESIQNLGPDLMNEASTKITEVEPRKVRIGGGRDEIDDSVSFLFRFMGRENELSGELYIRIEDNKWRIDDIIFDEPQKLSIGDSAFTSTYTPYERFY